MQTLGNYIFIKQTLEKMIGIKRLKDYDKFRNLVRINWVGNGKLPKVSEEQRLNSLRELFITRTNADRTEEKFQEFLNTSLVVFRGGEGTFDKNRKNTESSYSLDLSVAESYRANKYARKYGTRGNIANKYGWVIEATVKVRDILLYTNVDFEQELILDDNDVIICDINQD